MAYREIDPGPIPEGNFANFKAIGDKHAGIFISGPEEFTNNFGRKQNRWHFKNKDGPFSIDANFDLDRRLVAAQLKPGHKVIMTYVADLPSTKAGQSPMRQHKVMVDDAPPAAAVKAPPPPPPPAGDELDDIPL